MEKFNISAVVVSRNEGHLLESCLSKLAFCEELVVVDLECSDETQSVARRFNARVVACPVLPTIEQVHSRILDCPRHDWIITIDPDEVLDDRLIDDIVEEAKCLGSYEDIAAINAPIQYYFKGRPLKGTIWGGIRYGRLLINRKRTCVSPDVHAGKSIRPGFKKIALPHKDGNVIHHFWMNGYRRLFEKHRRYLKREGESLFNQGQKYSFERHLKSFFYAFIDSYVRKKGFKDGLRGFFLSMFWGWYNWSKWNSLRKFIKSREND